MKMSAVLGVVLALSAGSVQAQTPLKDVAHVREGLIAAGMAIEIGDQCDSISVRLLRGMNFLNSLKNHASGLGYSDAEIDAYVDDDAEKARLEDIARGRLADLGAVAGQGETYCAVGRDQMAQGTAVGRLLR